MVKLSPAARIVLSFALLLGGCGSGSSDLAARVSEALSTLTPSSPAQGQVVSSSNVVFSGRSSAASGSAVSVAATEGRLVVHTCPATVRSDQTWSCNQQLADGGYTWTARIAAESFTSAGIDFVVRTKGLAAPTIDQTPSPTKDSSPILTGTTSVFTGSCKDKHCHGEDGDDDDDAPVSLTVSENGKALCAVANVSSRQWSCKVSSKLADGSHLLVATVKRGDSTSPPSNPDLFVVKTSIAAPTVPPPPTIDSPADGSEVEDSRPVLTGRTAAGTTVQVTLDGAIYAAQVAPDGKWSLLPSAALPFGSHHVSAAAIDGDQNVSDPAQSTFRTVESGVARGGCSSGGTPWTLLAVAAFLAVLPRRRARALALLAAVALPVAAPAQATSMDVSLFRPASGGDGFVSVEGARPPL